MSNTTPQFLSAARRYEIQRRLDIDVASLNPNTNKDAIEVVTWLEKNWPQYIFVARKALAALKTKESL